MVPVMSEALAASDSDATGDQSPAQPLYAVDLWSCIAKGLEGILLGTNRKFVPRFNMKLFNRMRLLEAKSKRRNCTINTITQSILIYIPGIWPSLRTQLSYNGRA